MSRNIASKSFNGRYVTSWSSDYFTYRLHSNLTICLCTLHTKREAHRSASAGERRRECNFSVRFITCFVREEINVFRKRSHRVYGGNGREQALREGGGTAIKLRYGAIIPPKPYNTVHSVFCSVILCCHKINHITVSAYSQALFRWEDVRITLNHVMFAAFMMFASGHKMQCAAYSLKHNNVIFYLNVLKVLRGINLYFKYSVTQNHS